MSDLELRNRILDAARENFFANGFSKTTMEELAQSMGMSKKTIYKFFSSKDDLVREITRKKLHEIHHQCQCYREDQTLEFIEKIKSTISYITSQMQKIKQPFYLDVQKSMPDLWKEVDSFRNEKILHDFGAVVKQGVDLGIFRNDVNVEVFVLMYASAMRNIVNPEVLSHLPLNFSQAYQTAVTIFFEGMMTEEGRQQYKHKLSEQSKQLKQTKEEVIA